VTGISFTLLIEGVPADPDLLAAIQQIEVEDNAEVADMLRLRIAIAVKDGCSGWSVIDDNRFTRLASIRLLLTVGTSLPETLIHTYVTEANASFSNGPGQSTLNVVAMDPTVLMTLEEKVKPWPNMADSDIASSIFADPAYNFLPIVEPTTLVRLENDQTVTQRGADIPFLRQLARRNGYECYVETNPLTGLIEGHFHPPRLEAPPQGTLSVNMGEATNVNSFQARNDMMGPTTVDVAGLDVETQEQQPAQADSISQRTLGTGPTIADRPRRIRLSRTGLVQSGELQTYAQAVVDRSAWSIRAEGELNTVAYGGILRAKRPVTVRGAGRQYSGTYYVEKVLHTFGGDSYTQRFTLRRNALE
jgi:phage protein D